MSNVLNREIEVGEVVVLNKSYLKPEYHALEQRLFVCDGGSGMHGFTRGSGIFGYYLVDGERDRKDDNEISREETEAYQAERGKFAPPVA